MNLRRFFIDESGHNGDVAWCENDFRYAGQPVFTLAAVGVGNEHALRDELARLRSDFRINSDELKSTRLKTKLTPVAGALTDFLLQHDWPVFIEVVDKRFFLAIHIVNHLLCANLEGSEVDLASRNQMAEFLCDAGASSPFAAYVEACRAPDMERIRYALRVLWEWLETSDAEIARLVQLLTMFARDRARLASADPKDFLPLADVGEGGKSIWMLPNLSSLCNIYARINQWSNGDLDGISLVHHEQKQYERVLRDGKALMEALAKRHAVPFVPFANYQLDTVATLHFVPSKEESCVQVADILAGFVMRHVRDRRTRPTVQDDQGQEAFRALLGTCDPARATGINFVMTTRDILSMGIPTLSPHGFLPFAIDDGG